MQLLDSLLNRHQTPRELCLDLIDIRVRLFADSEESLAPIRKGFAARVVPEMDGEDCRVYLLQSEIEIPMDGMKDYVQPNGKVKERFLDQDNGRVAIKTKTGLKVVFTKDRFLMAGPVVSASNQVHNIINAIQMSRMEERGYTICHSAGLAVGGTPFAIAGRSGAGKTTTMLKLLSAGGTFISNDRLMVKTVPGGGYEMRGIVKWPRACAGTMMGDDKLRSLLDPADAARYGKLSYDELFELQEKYDISVPETYGADRIKSSATFERFYYLTWQRDGAPGFSIDQADTSSDGFWNELGPNIYRDAGVFNLSHQESVFTDKTLAHYRKLLAEMNFYIISGTIDFPAIGKAVMEHLGS